MLLDPGRMDEVERLADREGRTVRVGGNGPASRAAAQILEYLSGARRRFDVPVVVDGTAFQRDVWRALARIGYGRTITYGDLAARAGHPGASRAVGSACGMNPVPILVPCHRVIASGGRIGGFSGGLEIKTMLLGMEGADASTLVRPIAAKGSGGK